jgi:hypothetical protein
MRIPLKKQGKGKVVPVHTMTTHRGSRGIAALILNFSTRWGIAVNFLLWVLHPWGKNSWYQLNRSLDGPQSWSGNFRFDKA